MFPSEAAILMAIAVARDSGKKLLTRPMDVVGEYIGYLYDSLVKRGYLKRDGSAELIRASCFRVAGSTAYLRIAPYLHWFRSRLLLRDNRQNNM